MMLITVGRTALDSVKLSESHTEKTHKYSSGDGIIAPFGHRKRKMDAFNSFAVRFGGTN